MSAAHVGGLKFTQQICQHVLVYLTTVGGEPRNPNRGYIKPPGIGHLPGEGRGMGVKNDRFYG